MSRDLGLELWIGLELSKVGISPRDWVALTSGDFELSVGQLRRSSELKKELS